MSDSPAPVPNFSRPQGAKSQRHLAARRKGASGEREVLKALRDVMQNVEDELRIEGHDVRVMSDNVKRNSTQSDRGGADLYGIPVISVEVKRHETLSVNTWFEQCVRQAKNSELPVLIYRQSNSPWRVRTWVALTSPTGAVLRFTAATLDMPDFLAYWRDLYRAFLVGLITQEYREPDK